MSFTRDEERKIIQVIQRKGTEDYLMTWTDITEYLNDILGYNYESTNTYRRVAKKYEEIEGYEQKKIDLQIETVKVRDSHREYKADIRNQARIDTLNSRMVEAIKTLKPINIVKKKTKKGKTDAVVNCSDWHIGAMHDNYWGKYSVDIAKKRIQHYANEVIRYNELFNFDEILILNLGDMIEGMIHVSTRVQSELNAVDQTILAGELFANFIAHIENNTDCKISVGWVLDNHSRVHPNKKDHIEAESFGRLIMEFVQLRLIGSRANFVGNVIDDNIGYYNLGNKAIGWVHGHLHNPLTIEDKLHSGLDFKFDTIVMAHRHHKFEKGIVIQTGSPKGTDEYAKDKSLFTKPSQTIIVFEGNNKINIDIMLDKVN